MYDIWSNIHYGFVGRFVGFTEFELINGAGYAQICDNKSPYGNGQLRMLSIVLLI